MHYWISTNSSRIYLDATARSLFNVQHLHLYLQQHVAQHICPADGELLQIPLEGMAVVGLQQASTGQAVTQTNRPTA